LRAELGELRARVIRLERRLDALGLDTVPVAAPSTERSSGGALLDALGDGLDALGAFKG
jgi:hypothetical protein